MLTIFSDQDAKERSLAAGAADFLLKHKSPDEIVTAIRVAKQRPVAESNPPRI
jgi:DNA-binding NarL/FixJ family response regulator